MRFQKDLSCSWEVDATNCHALDRKTSQLHLGSICKSASRPRIECGVTMVFVYGLLWVSIKRLMSYEQFHNGMIACFALKCIHMNVFLRVSHQSARAIF